QAYGRSMRSSSDGSVWKFAAASGRSRSPERRNWQFPARVFQPFGGPAQLLNGPELEARVDGWLKAAGWSRTACGHWIFTWDAFRIECDPQSVIKTVQSFDLRSADLREGAPYEEAEARGPLVSRLTTAARALIAKRPCSQRAAGGSTLANGSAAWDGPTPVGPQRLATYIVISMPKRSSVALGVSHFISI